MTTKYTCLSLYHLLNVPRSGASYTEFQALEKPIALEHLVSSFLSGVLHLNHLYHGAFCLLVECEWWSKCRNIAGHILTYYNAHFSVHCDVLFSLSYSAHAFSNELSKNNLWMRMQVRDCFSCTC